MYLEFLQALQRGTPARHIPEGLFDVCGVKLSVLIVAHQNRVRSMFLEFLYIVEEGRTPEKRIPEGLF